jgi:hypothetical protein
MNRRHAVLSANIETIEIAMLESERQIGDAELAEQAQRDAEKAKRALDIAGKLTAKARILDDLLAKIASESIEMQAVIGELNHRLGCSHPHATQLHSLGERAVKAAMMHSAFKLEHLPPNERYSFSQLARGWADQIQRWAAPKLHEAAE